MPYPETRRVNQVDDYHGTPVADPYRWLEDFRSPEVIAWAEEQQAFTDGVLGALSPRTALRDRIEDLWNFPRTSLPIRRAGRTFFSHNDGLQNQAVHYWTERDETEWRVLIDPNTLSEDGAAAVTDVYPTEDGTLVGYRLAEGGSDDQVVRVRDVGTATDLDDEINWVTYTSVAWLGDGSGFYYARYPAPGEIPDAAERTHQKVFFHRLGDAQDRDRLVYERPDAPKLGFYPVISEDQRFLFLHVWEGTDHSNRLYYRPVDDTDGEFVRLFDEADAEYDVVHVDRDTLYLKTDLNAPGGRIVAVDLNHPEPDHWAEVLGEAEDATIDFCQASAGNLVVVLMRDAHHHVRIVTLAGEDAGEIDLPALGSISAMSGRFSDDATYLGFQSFLHFPTVLKHTGDSTEVVHTASNHFDASAFETTISYATSTDGTRVPIFLTGAIDHGDGPRPTLLYGYGGFRVNMTPAFSPARLAFLEAGGVFAQAILRGGGEFGEEWHAAGMLSNKQNVFDDFISCAEHLITQGVTTPDQLGIYGGSNGGLLTAACLLQRPDLFGAVISAVPVTDMLRYQRFAAGVYWTPEYGDAEESSEHFRFLHAYSPAHNVEAGVNRPPVLITTAESDDRVVPLHAYKFAAALQHAEPENQTLLRVELRAGHGLGKPIAKLIDEAADVYAFALDALT